MRLTKAKALDISIELWTWLSEEDGRDNKGAWPGWGKYGRMTAHCPLCQYQYLGEQRQFDTELYDCTYCPLPEDGGERCYRLGFGAWDCTRTKETAAAFLKVLKEAREKLEKVKP